MLNNLTDNELINLDPKTELESELIKRLSGNTQKDWDDMEQRVEKLQTKLMESEEALETLRDALKKVATEIYRCGYFGLVLITPDFRERCRDTVCSIEEIVAYELPKGVQPNNTSSFMAGGKV